MYSSGGFLMVLGVLLSLSFILGIVWYVNNQIPKHLKRKNG